MLIWGCLPGKTPEWKENYNGPPLSGEENQKDHNCPSVPIIYHQSDLIHFPELWTAVETQTTHIYTNTILETIFLVNKFLIRVQLLFSQTFCSLWAGLENTQKQTHALILASPADTLWHSEVYHKSKDEKLGGRKQLTVFSHPCHVAV